MAMVGLKDRNQGFSCQGIGDGARSVPITLAVFLTVSLVFFLRLGMLLQSPFANGLDGYYYAEQIKSFHDLGHFIIVDNSPVLYFMGLANFPIGDPVLTTKCVGAFFGAALCLCVFWFLGRAGCSPLGSLVGCLGAGLSPTLGFLSIDYVKNLGALVLWFLAAGVLVSLFYQRRFSLKTLGLGLSLFCLTFLAHRVSAVLLLIFGVTLVFFRFKKNKVLLGILWLGLSLLVVLLVQLKGGFLLSDLQRVLPAVSPVPSLPLFSSAFQDQLPQAVVVELSLAFFIPYFCLFIPRPRGGVFYALTLSTLILFLPIWDLSSLDLGFRLFSNGVPLALALFCLGAWGAPSPGLSLPRVTWPQVLILGLVLSLLPWGKKLYNPAHDPPFRLYQRITARVNLPADSLLICHPGLNNFYTYTHQLKDALAFLPEWTVPDEKLWRLSFGVDRGEFLIFIPEFAASGLVTPLGGGYALIREDGWQTFLSRCGEERKKSLENWFNPYQRRPQFLLDKNK